MQNKMVRQPLISEDKVNYDVIIRTINKVFLSAWTVQLKLDS